VGRDWIWLARQCISVARRAEEHCLLTFCIIKKGGQLFVNSVLLLAKEVAMEQRSRGAEEQRSSPKFGASPFISILWTGPFNLMHFILLIAWPPIFAGEMWSRQQEVGTFE